MRCVLVKDMDRWLYPSLGSLRRVRVHDLTDTSAHVVPQGHRGAGQWTGHPAGLVVVIAVMLMVLVGIPEARPFFVAALLLGAALGCILWLRHKSKGFF